MKKKLLLLILLAFPFFVNASSMYQEIDIQENGDLKVKESITLDGSYNGFELDIGYKYFDEYKLYSADSLEVIRVCESSKTNPLTDIGDCFTKVSSASVGDSLLYTHENGVSEDKFMLYNPSSRRKSFYIEYVLKNVVVGHNDINELRLNILNHSFKESLDKVSIKVNLPKTSSDLRAWAHGPLWGNITLDDNKNYVLFEVDDYSAYTAIDIRMTFDKNLIITSKETNRQMLDSIIEEETIRANAANKEREDAIKKEEEIRKEYERVKRVKNISFYIISTIWIISGIILFINFRKKHDKEYISEFKEDYYRDFPSNHSPEIIEYLMNKRVSEVGFSSTILNIIYKKGFIVEKKTTEKGIIFKKEVDDYELILNDKDLKEELTELEKNIRTFLVIIYGDSKAFYLSSLDKVNDSEKSAKTFLNKFNYWKKETEKLAKKEEFFEDTDSKKTWLILFSIIPFIMVPIYIEYNSLVIFLALIALVLIIYVATSNKRTKKGNELYLKWNALKRFLKDFGNFEEKELPEISLWEKYLVYAHVFGIAEELRRQMEIKIPNIDNYSNGLNSYDYMRLNYAINRSVTTNVTAAIRNANSKIAESNASSGSGSGGGFSGGSFGGGFSSGGGSGGGRF